MSVKNPNPVDIAVGKRLRLRRMMLCMSQEGLAHKVNLTFQQVQKYERAFNRISASRLYQFAQVLDVPVSYFFEELPSTVSVTSAAPETKLSEIAQSRDGLALNQAFANIGSPKVRHSVVDLCKALSNGAVA